MVYYPEERDEIMINTLPTPLDLRVEKLHKMQEEKKSRLSFIDDFFDSEENQKKYGFTTEVVNGIRSVYYDGDIDVLNEAIYGSRVEAAYPDIDSERLLHLREQDGCLYARIPHKNEDVPVKIRIGNEYSRVPNFALVSEEDVMLTQLCLTDPAYFPKESDCNYILDLKGLSVLNKFVRNNFTAMIEEWNRLHPAQTLETDIPLPNYRFLASAAYANLKTGLTD